MSGADRAAARIADVTGYLDVHQLADIIREEVASDYPIPGPYEIALRLGCALASTGRFETPGAALQAAWASVPEFFQGRDFYLRDIVPIVYGQAAPPATPDAAADEDFRA